MARPSDLTASTVKPPTARISCIILAAGTSSRMGPDNKLLLPWEDQVVVDTVINTISSLNPFEVIVVTSEITAAHFSTGNNLKIVDNPQYQTGMTSSIKAGVTAAQDKSDGYMICLGDQPTLTAATYKKILSTFSASISKNKASIIAPFYNGSKGNPVLFSSMYRQDILEHKEPEGCKKIIQSNANQLIKLEVDDESVLLDMDTPEKYREIRKRFLGIE
jgi:molybdenum cofactor cytidylyltransferase